MVEDGDDKGWMGMGTNVTWMGTNTRPRAALYSVLQVFFSFGIKLITILSNFITQYSL